MVITNFAAGELSENLFGRIDIAPYYSGVSRLENFDVIPTGGIERRAGTGRLLNLGERGRLIPFYTDRQTHFLLYLSPGKIRVIKNGTLQQTLTGSAGLPLYQTLAEITEVQYAQNFDTMILAHERYKPLAATYAKETASIDFTVFEAHYRVETKTSGETDFVYEIDTKNEKYLCTPDNYPRCVSFYNGRLIFAGTKNDPQRVFASKVNDIYSFATYKLFVTEQKEYISVFGNAFDGRDTIELADGQAAKFVKPLPEYYVDSPYFPRNYTKAVAFLSGDAKELRLSNRASIPGALSQGEVDAINSKTEAYIAAETNKQEYVIGRVVDSAPYRWTLKIRTGAKNLIFISSADWSNDPGFSDEETYPLPNNAAAFIPNDAVYLVNFIKAIPYIYFPGNLKPQLYEDVIQTAAANWADTVRNTMQMNFRGEMLYDIPENIRIYINANTTPGIDAYIPFYTRKIIEDRYPTPDDGFTFEIASDMSDAIRWLALNKGIIIGTETAEWIIPPDVNATNVYATRNSQYGSDTVQGTVINDAACFFQTGRKALVEYYIPQQDNNFRANNMAMFSKNMLGESPAVEFDFIRSPYTKLFITRQDGAVVTLLYERGTGTFAWGRITTAGSIRSVAVLPGADGNDDVYLAVERNGAVYLEALREAAEVYLDSFQEWTGNSAGYTAAAVIFQEAGGTTLPLTAAPPASTPAQRRWIGYPYASRARSMPILANDRMRPNNIKSLLVRFLDSFMPRVYSLPNNAGDTIPHKAPYSGIVRVPFPGVWDHDVMFEFVHEQPTRCKILAITTEVN